MQRRVGSLFDLRCSFQPVKEMRPNDDMHAEFGEALRQAKEAGVNILCLDCLVTPGLMIIDKLIPVVLKKLTKKWSYININPIFDSWSEVKVPQPA